MRLLRIIFNKLSKKERIVAVFFLIILLTGVSGSVVFFVDNKTTLAPRSGGSWTEGVSGQPTIINPVFSAAEADQAISSLVYGYFERLIENTVSDDPSLYTVTLKENLFWSDGKPLTSDDVIFTIQSIQNPEMRSPLFKNWQGIVVERVSELQMRFILPSPYVFFEENLNRLQIIPKHIWENAPLSSPTSFRYALLPIGSGPFEIKRTEKRQDGFIEAYHFVQNQYFSGNKPYLKNFTVYFYQNEEALHRAFHLKKINGFGSATVLKNTDTFSGIIENMPMSRYYAVFWNPAKNIALKDKNLRFALDRATPRTEIKEKVFDGNATIIDSPVIYGEDLLRDEAEGFNIESAKEFFNLSKEEGTVISLTVPDTKFLIETAEILKRNWESIGIKEVKILALDPKDVFENAIRNGDYEAILFGNILENPKDLFSFWHSSQRGYPGLNLANYTNSKADSLMEEIRTTGNTETLDAKLQSLELSITGDSPAVFLYSLPFFYVHESRLQGFDASRIISSPADRLRNVASWYVDNERVLKSN